MVGFEIRVDDLSGAATQALLGLHLGEMQENSPVGSVNALDLAGLKASNVTFWSAWEGEALAGFCGLKVLTAADGELKSMRTAPTHLRRGVAALLLDHVIAEARKRGMEHLSLETGSGPTFEAAIALYKKRGFRNGPAFSDYAGTDFNRFLHLDL